MVIDSKLTFNTHIDVIVQRAYKQLGFILRVCKPFRQEITYKILYFSLVRSILDFGCIIWSPFYKCHISRIERVQRKFLNALDYRMGKGYSSYLKTLACHNLLSLEKRRTQFDVMFLFKIIHCHVDSPSLLGNISFKVPRRNARHQKLFSVPFSRTKYYANSYLNRCLNYCNKDLSDIDILAHRNCLTFKNRVISHLCV